MKKRNIMMKVKNLKEKEEVEEIHKKPEKDLLIKAKVQKEKRKLLQVKEKLKELKQWLQLFTILKKNLVMIILNITDLNLKERKNHNQRMNIREKPKFIEQKLWLTQ